MKIVVYTAVFGGYDSPPDMTSQQREGIEFYCISDNEKGYPGWKNIYTNDYAGGGKYKLAKTNRYYKTQPHNFFPSSDINVYLDGNRKLFNIDMLKQYCVDLWNDDNTDVIFCRHTQRDTIQQEAKEIIRLGRDSKDIVEPQVKGYIDEGFPDNIKLISANVMIRKTHSASLQSVLNTWWNEIKYKSYRDQISLPYSIWKNNFTKFKYIDAFKERLKMISNVNHAKPSVKF